MALRDNSNDNLNIISPAGDPKVGQECYQIMLDQMEDKKERGLPRKWIRNYKYKWNKYWRKRSTYKLPLISGNLIYRHMQNTVTYITDGKPTFNALQFGEGNEMEDKVTRVQRAADYWWTETEQQGVFSGSVENGETYGPAIEHVQFDSDAEGGKGEVSAEIIDPFCFGVYPFDVIENQKADANFTYCLHPAYKVKQRYPDKADEIKADSAMFEELGEERRDIEDDISESTQRLQSLGMHIDFSKPNVKDKVLVLTFWVKDYSMITERYIETGEIGEDGKPIREYLEDKDPRLLDGSVEYQCELMRWHIVETQKPKYPGYLRRIVVCNAGQLVLEDEPNPSINPNVPEEQAQNTYLWDKFPYTRVVSIEDNTNPWGMCDIEQIAELAFEFQKTLSQIVRIKDTKARVKVINPLDSGVDNSQFTNQNGVVRPASSLQSQAIRFLETPTDNSDLYQASDYFKNLFFLITGSFEIENAQSAGGGSLAYKALELLSEKIQGLMRGKARNYSKLVRERGRMYTSHVFNWYTEDRVFSYEEDGKRKTDVIRGGAGNIIPIKLTVVDGSTLPKSRVQVREEAVSLYAQGSFGLPAVQGGNGSAEKHLLKRMEYDGWADIVDDIQKGVFGPMLDKLTLIGIPREITDFYKKIISMDDSELQKGLEEGTIPPFKVFLQAIMGQKPTPQEQMQQLAMAEKQAQVQKAAGEAQRAQAQAQREQAEIQKVIAEAEKIKADAEKAKAEAANQAKDLEVKESEKVLNYEKAKTEQVKQKQAEAGIFHDNEAMKIQKAETAAKIREAKKNSAKQISGDFFRETGRVSNNRLT